MARKLESVRALRVQEAEEADRELETVLQELAAAKRSLKPYALTSYALYPTPYTLHPVS